MDANLFCILALILLFFVLPADVKGTYANDLWVWVKKIIRGKL